MFRFELFCDDKLVVPLLRQLGSTKGVYMRSPPTPVVGATVEKGKVAGKPSAGPTAVILAMPSTFTTKEAKASLIKAGENPASLSGLLFRLVHKTKVLKRVGVGKYRKVN